MTQPSPSPTPNDPAKPQTDEGPPKPYHIEDFPVSATVEDVELNVCQLSEDGFELINVILIPKRDSPDGMVVRHYFRYVGFNDDDSEDLSEADPDEDADADADLDADHEPL